MLSFWGATTTVTVLYSTCVYSNLFLSIPTYPYYIYLSYVANCHLRRRQPFGVFSQTER